jgi:hypothetical protein
MTNDVKQMTHVKDVSRRETIYYYHALRTKVLEEQWFCLMLSKQTVLGGGGFRIHIIHTIHTNHTKIESGFRKILWNFTSKSHNSQDSHNPLNPSPVSNSSHTKSGIFLTDYETVY